MPSFFKRLRGVLGFSKTEMNGLIILLPLILFFVLLPSLYTKYFQPEYDSFEDQRILDSLIAVIEANKDSLEESYMTPERFFFDPNSLPKDSLLLLGLNESIAQRIVNYRKAKGVFRKPGDVAKIYGLTDSLFQEIKPWISIRTSSISSTSQNKPKPYKAEIEPDVQVVEKVSVSINQADTVTWMKLKGIGPTYSNRIVRFRSALGGFVSVDQIAEVYGISDSLFLALRPQLLLNDSSVKKLPINLATFKELNAHPYISFDQTKEILNTKSTIGKYRTIADLFNLKSFDSLSVKRLIPYLDFR